MLWLLQILFNLKNTPLALTTLLGMSSVPQPSLETVAPKYTNLSTSSIPRSFTSTISLFRVFIRSSLFSPSEKCSNHRLSLLSLSLRILPVLQHSTLVFRCLILCSVYTVCSCVVVQPHFQLLLQSLQSIFSYLP